MKELKPRQLLPEEEVSGPSAPKTWMGVIAGYHMITSWNQAFFQGIPREAGASKLPATRPRAEDDRAAPRNIV